MGEIRKKCQITESTAVTDTDTDKKRPVETKPTDSAKRIDTREVNVARKAKQFEKPEQKLQDPKGSTYPKSK